MRKTHIVVVTLSLKASHPLITNLVIKSFTILVKLHTCKNS